ncbi:MAG: 3-dehydroquinate synthase [Spirochaetales bacterium]|nr:3-dehydroquinate synthase [Spirochaetales bacterium]
MEKRIEVTLQNNVKSNVWFTVSNEEMSEKILSLSPSYVIVTDEHTLCYSPDKERTVVLKSGEENKNWEGIEKILSFALSHSMARDGVFVAIGGGVVCDMTALAAALFMRGARLVLCPTTLLSMVDASLGGKAAIDFMNTKNTVGAFYPAEDVILSFPVLSSLNDKEFMCGMGEVVKHAFLSEDDTLYKFLFSNKDKILERDNETLLKMVELSLLVKKSYIERDPMETKGIRSALNLGHTFGHALESITDYSISHGEAVVWGMKKALTSGLWQGITPPEFYLWCIDLISQFPFHDDYKVQKKDYERFIEATKKDKKKSGGTTKFVFLKGLGEPVLSPLSDDQIAAMIV